MDETDEKVFESFVLNPLTIEELVKQDRTVEDTFHFNRGIWWKKIKPFFEKHPDLETSMMKRTIARLEVL